MTKLRPGKDDRRWDPGRTDSGLQIQTPTSSAISGVVFGLQFDLALVCDADPDWDQEFCEDPKSFFVGSF